jgi:hypothetical protein
MSSKHLCRFVLLSCLLEDQRTGVLCAHSVIVSATGTLQRQPQQKHCRVPPRAIQWHRTRLARALRGPREHQQQCRLLGHPLSLQRHPPARFHYRTPPLRLLRPCTCILHVRTIVRATIAGVAREVVDVVDGIPLRVGRGCAHTTVGHKRPRIFKVFST